MGKLARLHAIKQDSERFPNRSGKVFALDIDSDLVKWLKPGSTANSKLVTHFGEGFEILESQDEAAFWLQDPLQLQGASAAVNLAAQGSVANIEYDNTGDTVRATVQGAAAIPYFTNVTTAVSGGLLKLPVPSAYKVVQVINNGANDLDLIPDDDATPIDSVASGSTAVTVAVGGRTVMYCKADSSLGWFTL